MWDKRKLIEELQDEFIRSKKVYLATDPDREGEAISWHLAHLLERPEGRLPRHVPRNYEKAVLAGMEDPKPIDLKKVDAQQARRVLDRIVGVQAEPPCCGKRSASGLEAPAACSP